MAKWPDVELSFFVLVIYIHFLISLISDDRDNLVEIFHRSRFKR